ncbi:MAG: DNA-formamidopyrimidine glycosylase [Mycoplasmataceae bacterium]|nr:DNA-formamidopyrimidine glycosylase [Mycoplasmataceae bacterium]
MPELPEVVTVCKTLELNILNLEIKTVKLETIKALRNQSVDYLNNLNNQKIIALKSKGKNLIIQTNDYWLVLHLRMEGKFFFIPKVNDEFNKHNILTINFLDNKLLFNDHRKFATIDIFGSSADLNKFLEKVGPEPWDVNIDSLYNQIKDKRTSIKQTLLDQKYMSGLGNIYVDEVLYASKIMPTRKTNSITYDQLVDIVRHSRIILWQSILVGGSTISTFQSQHGVDGKFQNQLKVHSRKGAKCPNGEKVQKIVVGGRGTYYCPGVQN